MKNILKLLFIFWVAGVSAQKNADPTDEDIETAKKIRSQYDHDDVAVIESNELVTFGINKDASKVTVNNRIREKYMNISHRADIMKYEFYNSESKIETFSLSYRNEKKANFLIADELYKDRDLFYNDARVKHVAVDFPVMGYTYNYEMEKKFSDVKYFTALYFNDEYPVMHKTVQITVPEWLDVELKEFNFTGANIVKTVKPDPKGGGNIYTYEVSDMPGYYKDENAPGRSYLYPHIIVVAKSFSNKGKQTQLFKSADDLYKWYKSLTDLMNDDPSTLKSKVEELTSKAKSDEEKIRNIYYWVQDNIRYIAFEDGIAGFKPDESQNVFQKRYGDCKGMANLIKQMLKIAGFDARLTWIGTRHISYDYSTPSLAVDNHMICTLMHNGKKYFLDGTEKYNSFGSNAERIQGKDVMIEDGDKYIIDKVPSCSSTSNKETYIAHFKIEGEALKGTCSRTYTGESCSGFLYSYNTFQSDKKDRALDLYLSRSDKNLTVDNVVSTDFLNRDQKLSISYDLRIDNKVSGFDNEIYLDLNLQREFTALDFSKRKTEYQFQYKTDYETSVSVDIPTGYKVSKLPENLSVATADYTVGLTFAEVDGTVVCKKSFIFPKGAITLGDMQKWNETFKKIIEIYNQQIVLTKS